jgi:hypothetical protein
MAIHKADRPIKTDIRIEDDLSIAVDRNPTITTELVEQVFTLR